MKKLFETWFKFVNEQGFSMVPEPETSEYEKTIASVEKAAGLDPEAQKAAAAEKPKKKTSISGTIKRACKCVDSSESGLSVEEIKKLINKYYTENNPDPSFEKLDINSDCDLKTQKAIMQFQADTGARQDGCVGDETEEKMVEVGILGALTTTAAALSSFTTKEKDLTNTYPTSDVEYQSSASMSHVEEAKKEMKLFKNGKLKEWEKDAWPHIAKYWNHIKNYKAEKGTKNGFYGRAGKDNNWHWSAAFIQYCMRGNAEFKKLRWSGSGPGNHQYYWRAAKMNTKKLEAGNLRKGEWFYLSMAQAAKIGYKPQVGDILFIGDGKPKHHGDIVISTTGGPSSAGGYKKVGGNNSHSVMLQWRKNTGLITQNPAAYDLFRGISPGSQNSEIEFPAVPKEEAGKYSFVLGTVDGDIVASHNANKEIYGASIQKPIAALVQMIQYKQDEDKKLNDKELGMLLSYSKTFRGSNQVNRAISRDFRGGKPYYQERTLGKIDPRIMRQVLGVFGITNTKFVFNNNKQSSLDYYKFLSGLARMKSGNFRNEQEEKFADLYGDEIDKIFKYTTYIPPNIKKSFNNIGINNFWGKGGRALGALNYGIVIDNKHVLVVYTRFGRGGKLGSAEHALTGRGGAHTNMMLSIVKKLFDKIK